MCRFVSDDRPLVPALRALVADEGARRYWREHLHDLVPERRYAAKTVLELGGADGRHAVWLAQGAVHVTVVDRDARIEWGRALAGDLAQVLFVQGNPERPPLAPRRYDLVLVTVPPTPGVLEAAIRMARGGGEIVVEAKHTGRSRVLRSLTSRLPLPVIERACAAFAQATGADDFLAARLAERLAVSPARREALHLTADRAGLQLIESRHRAIRWRKPPFPGQLELASPAAQVA